MPANAFPILKVGNVEHPEKLKKLNGPACHDTRKAPGMFPRMSLVRVALGGEPAACIPFRYEHKLANSHCLQR